MGKYEAKTPILGNTSYDIIERTTTYGLPAVAAFYLTLSGLWKLPYPEEISATILALVVLLRVFLGIAKSSYKNSTERLDGTLEVTENDGTVTIQPNLAGLSVNDVTSKREVILAVTQPPSQ